MQEHPAEQNATPGTRRCRVALLPDSHVQPGRDSAPPTHPTKRLYNCARWLLETYMKRIATMEVDAILLLGDTLDPADADGMKWLRKLIKSSEVPVHVLIGNHEIWGRVSAAQFHHAMGLPEAGHQLVRVKDVPFLMLATPDQDSLNPGTPGHSWLQAQLASVDASEDLFCCAHFSLLLHPCVAGWKNDGMQLLWSGEQILGLLRQHPNVRAWIAGHKNVPSKVIRDGVLHLLSPQLIQAPCGYRILDIHTNGIHSRVYDINEENLARLSREAHGEDYPERHGTEADRNFWWSWR